MNKMMLVIRTQDRENYAAHQGFDGTYYWKNKGGEEFKVTNIPSMTAENVTSMVMSVRPLIEKDNDYFQTTIIDWSIEADDYLSSFEQSQLEYDGAINYPEPIIPFEDVPYLLQIAEMEKVQALQEIE